LGRAGVYENKGGAVLFDQFSKPGVHLVPDFRGHDRFERRVRNLKCEVAIAVMSRIHNGTIRESPFATAVADQKSRDIL
jgi:hypothetical protein